MKRIKLSPSCHQLAIAGRVIEGEQNQADDAQTGQGGHAGTDDGDDAEAGQPIAGALVELTQVPSLFEKRLKFLALQYGDRWETLSKRPDRTYTATDGYFHFIDLPDGQYGLTVSLPNTGTRYGTVTVPGQSHRPGELKIILVKLPPTALQGVIKEDNKEIHIPMAKIQLDGSGESAWSDAKGNYRLIGLEASPPPTGSRMVTASAQGYDSKSELITLEQGKTQPLNFDLQKSPSLQKPQTAK